MTGKRGRCGRDMREIAGPDVARVANIERMLRLVSYFWERKRFFNQETEGEEKQEKTGA